MNFLPISEISICAGHDLRANDFAYLHSLNDVPVFVVAVGEDLVAIFVADRSGDFTLANVDELTGPATRVSGVEIRPDFSSAKAADRTFEAGTLEVKFEKLALLALNHGRPLSYPISDFEVGQGVHANIRFTRWQAIKSIGDEEHVLFQRDSE